MSNVTLSVGVQTDIDETFCYDPEHSYQERCHAYIERYEIMRDWFHGGTAVRSVVMDLCERAFVAGTQMTSCDRPTEPDRDVDERPARSMEMLKGMFGSAPDEGVVETKARAIMSALFPDLAKGEGHE